jgi:DnaK suppressor protein
MNAAKLVVTSIIGKTETWISRGRGKDRANGIPRNGGRRSFFPSGRTKRIARLTLTAYSQLQNRSALAVDPIVSMQDRRYKDSEFSRGARRLMKSADMIDDAYRPSEEEPFMNDRQREYFRRKLVTWKEEILRESRETLAALQSENENHPDFADRASSETDRAIELRARDRQRKLIAKINSALERIDDGSYGYCEETGDPISLKRLDARPIATLSVEAQERHERRERVYRDD